LIHQTNFFVLERKRESTEFGMQLMTLEQSEYLVMLSYFLYGLSPFRILYVIVYSPMGIPRKESLLRFRRFSCVWKKEFYWGLCRSGM